MRPVQISKGMANLVMTSHTCPTQKKEKQQMIITTNGTAFHILFIAPDSQPGCPPPQSQYPNNNNNKNNTAAVALDAGHDCLKYIPDLPSLRVLHLPHTSSDTTHHQRDHEKLRPAFSLRCCSCLLRCYGTYRYSSS